jgi:hypothetical protein
MTSTGLLRKNSMFVILSIATNAFADMYPPPVYPCEKLAENESCIFYGKIPGQCKKGKIENKGKYYDTLHCKPNKLNHDTHPGESWWMIGFIIAVLIGFYPRWRK